VPVPRLLIAAALALVPLVAPAVAAEPFLAADATNLGAIELYYFGDVGTEVRFYERVGAQSLPLVSGTISYGDHVNLLAARWRCDRLTRQFEATAIGPDGRPSSGSFELRTPSCRDRVALTAPRQAGSDGRFRVVFSDRWSLGLPVRVCLEAPTGRQTCELTAAPAGGGAVERDLRARTRGRWVVELRYDHFRLRRAVWLGRIPKAAQTGSERAKMLVTGDSTIQGIDAFLEDDLAKVARVQRDYRIGTGISQDAPDWRETARALAVRHKPRVTVISIGANDGFAMQGVACCDAAWIAEYARRARTIMETFARGGRSHVLWLTLPAPQDPRRQVVTAAVNEAIVTAAAGVPAVRLVPVAEVLTPNGVFRRTVRRDGRTVSVRAPDGVHLSVEGTRIAADLVAEEVASHPQIVGGRARMPQPRASRRVLGS
jgi:lysophospholipase L1-like esterase